MGSVKQRIQEDLKQAMRARDEIRVGALRMLLSSLLNKEKEKRYKISKDGSRITERELDEKAALGADEVQDTVSSEVKKRREAIEAFSAHGGSASGGEKERIENAIEKERKELEVLQAYLPEQLGEEEIRQIVKEAIEKVGALRSKDMGKVMAELAPKTKGKADGSQVSKIVKELLQ